LTAVVIGAATSTTVQNTGAPTNVVASAPSPGATSLLVNAGGAAGLRSRWCAL